MTAANYFKTAFTVDSLRQVYIERVSLTQAVGIDRLNRRVFDKRLDEEIKIISRKVLNGTYKFSLYQEKLISKGPKKYPRVVSIPTFRDRVTLRALCNVLRNTYDGKLDTKLPQHTIEILRNELKRGGFSFFIKLDVKNFYPSLDHKTLDKALKQKVRKQEIKRLINSAITTPTVAYPDSETPRSVGGIPQGLSISNILAEIYLLKFDDWAKNLANVFYVRYVDDILLLTNEMPEKIYKEFRSKLLREYGLEVHGIDLNGKSRLGDINDQFYFLGYEFKERIACVKVDSIRRIEASLAKIFTIYKYKYEAASQLGSNKNKKIAWKIFLWRLNLRITGCIFEEVRRGWVFYFSQIDEKSLTQLHHLDKTVLALAKRFSIFFKKNELKSFVRTFHETSRKDSKQSYILNFDSVDINYQRDILKLYGLKRVDAMNEDEVTLKFKSRIRRETSELELDIQGIS